MLKRRAGGILLHITSLPSRYGVGDFGPAAFAFADFLKTAGAAYWQMLPLNHTEAVAGHSPYNCFSAFAGNPLLISLERLVRDGLLKKSDLADTPTFAAGKADFAGAMRFKTRLLHRAFERFAQQGEHADFETFKAQHRDWLDDFALFKVLDKTCRKKSWLLWPAAIRRRQKSALERFGCEYSRAVEREKFIQYLFMTQFGALKQYCNDNGILLFGDLPIYVTHNSADVWANPDLFKLRRGGQPAFIAGVPPDYFSRTGQLWGNPVYDWGANAKTNYRWWIARLRHNLALFDLLRIDHFRAFQAYWQVPYGSKTAVNGQWKIGPGADFFNAVFRCIANPPLVAEDLGFITPAVRELIAAFDIPSMKVLQFAFDGGTDNVHLPFCHTPDSVVYTGTHDNNTTIGWYKTETSKAVRKRLADYLGKPVSSRTIAMDMMRLAMASPSRLCIVPMQDVLELDRTARMNNPSRHTGNWRWQLVAGQLKGAAARRLRSLLALYGRL